MARVELTEEQRREELAELIEVLGIVTGKQIGRAHV